MANGINNTDWAGNAAQLSNLYRSMSAEEQQNVQFGSLEASQNVENLPHIGNHIVKRLDNNEKAADIRNQLLDNLSQMNVGADQMNQIRSCLLGTGEASKTGSLSGKEISDIALYALSSPANVKQRLGEALQVATLPHGVQDALKELVTKYAHHPDVVAFLTGDLKTPADKLSNLQKLCKLALSLPEINSGTKAYLIGFAGSAVPTGGVHLSDDVKTHVHAPAEDANYHEGQSVDFTGDADVRALFGKATKESVDSAMPVVNATCNRFCIARGAHHDVDQLKAARDHFKGRLVESMKEQTLKTNEEELAVQMEAFTEGLLSELEAPKEVPKKIINNSLIDDEDSKDKNLNEEKINKDDIVDQIINEELANDSSKEQPVGKDDKLKESSPSPATELDVHDEEPVAEESQEAASQEVPENPVQEPEIKNSEPRQADFEIIEKDDVKDEVKDEVPPKKVDVKAQVKQGLADLAKGLKGIENVKTATGVTFKDKLKSLDFAFQHAKTDEAFNRLKADVDDLKKAADDAQTNAANAKAEAKAAQEAQRKDLETAKAKLLKNDTLRYNDWAFKNKMTAVLAEVLPNGLPDEDKNNLIQKCDGRRKDFLKALEKIKLSSDDVRKVLAEGDTDRALCKMLLSYTLRNDPGLLGPQEMFGKDAGLQERITLFNEMVKGLDRKLHLDEGFASGGLDPMINLLKSASDLKAAYQAKISEAENLQSDFIGKYDGIHKEVQDAAQLKEDLGNPDLFQYDALLEDDLMQLAAENQNTVSLLERQTAVLNHFVNAFLDQKAIPNGKLYCKNGLLSAWMQDGKHGLQRGVEPSEQIKKQAAEKVEALLVSENKYFAYDGETKKITLKKEGVKLLNNALKNLRNNLRNNEIAPDAQRQGPIWVPENRYSPFMGILLGAVEADVERHSNEIVE